jgi:hypothetical protein
MDGVISFSSKNPLEMVLATSVERKAPIRLRTAASRTAVRGFSAPVATGPAMAFALSWKPLVKSKMRATTMTAITTNNRVTAVPFLQGGLPVSVTPAVMTRTYPPVEQ